MSQMEFHKHKKRPLRGKGFYIALALCILSVGAVSWLTFGTRPKVQTTPKPESDAVISSEDPSSKTESDASKTENDPSSAEKSELPAETVSETVAEPKQENVSSVTEPAESIAPPSEEPPAEEVKETAATPTSFIVPVAGEVLKEYSPQASLYSLTFGDWRTHSGVDLKATKGSNVKSVAAGQVSEVYTDDLLGTVVAVKYGDLEVLYCGMSATPVVKPGEAVKQGQVLGSLGEIPGECVEEAHLHLEVKQKGETVDPLVALGKKSAESQ